MTFIFEPSSRTNFELIAFTNMEISYLLYEILSKFFTASLQIFRLSLLL